jgi:DNA-binding winged helix-turn-helix (wHTH) protein/TolB-like protein
MAGPAYVWDQWRFEPTECRLMRDGTIVPLPAKTLDLLSTLLRRAPRLVTKEEILAAVWRDAAVEEGNIAFHVAALRKVLDQEDGPSAIETIRGRGYRFVHEVAIHQLPATDDVRQVVVEAASASTPSTAARKSAPIAMIVAGLIAVLAIGAFAWFKLQSGPPSIAVQPFQIVNPAVGQENFPDGLGTYLTSKIALAGLEIAMRDEADAVLGGQLHPTANGFRVNVQLSRVGDSARLWDWSFDVGADEERPVGEPDDERSRVQALIATRVADGLRNYFNLSGAASATR